MADYPDWVMKHKRKGTYINRVKDKYYLYAAHSERIHGTNKVRRVSDGYIGRITEKDGLIPTREKVSGDVVVYKYGLHMTALALSGLILKGLRREYREAANRVFVEGVLLAFEGNSDEEAISESYLTVIFPGIINQALNERHKTGVERCSRMVKDKFSKACGDDSLIASRLGKVYAVYINKKRFLSKMPDGVGEWLIKNDIDWEGLE